MVAARAIGDVQDDVRAVAAVIGELRLECDLARVGERRRGERACQRGDRQCMFHLGSPGLGEGGGAGGDEPWARVARGAGGRPARRPLRWRAAAADAASGRTPRVPRPCAAHPRPRVAVLVGDVRVALAAFRCCMASRNGAFTPEHAGGEPNARCVGVR
ncbi:hypothetical protein DP56_5934 [Burkholderia pseudomallei]|nr:hypothetical protein DP56_5934 [Burkholderia pseudomallei]